MSADRIAFDARTVSSVIETPMPNHSAVGDTATILQLPKIRDARGNLTFIEGGRHVPFPIRRVYYLYDAPAGATRGGHAHRNQQEFVISASGSFTVDLDDGVTRESYFLNSPSSGLYIPRMVWRELHNFSSGSVCLVVASEEYDESDYLRNYDDFLCAAQEDRRSAIS